MPEAEEESLKQVLRPIIRHCIRSSNRIQSLIKIIKAVYVEVALEELQFAGKKVNMSRINVMTGVQRVDIAKIYKNKEPLKQPIGDIVQRVIGQWNQDKQFLTKEGKPRVLSIKGADSDFSRLVAKITTSVGPSAVLFELERAGAVERSKMGLRLLAPTLRHGSDRRGVPKMLGRSVEALMSASFENGLSEQEEKPHLHIRTYYDNIYKKDLPKIQLWLKSEGRKFHKKAREYISKFDKDIGAKRDEPAGAAVVLGAFSYTTERAEADLFGD